MLRPVCYQVSETELLSFVCLGLYPFGCEMDQVLFPNDQELFKLPRAHLPTYPLFSPDENDRPLWLSPSPCSFWLLLCTCLPFSVPTWQSGTIQEIGGMLILLAEKCFPGVGRSRFLARQANRLMLPTLLNSMSSSLCSLSCINI